MEGDWATDKVRRRPVETPMSITSSTSEVDRHLLSLIQAGDSDAWSDFVISYQTRLLSFARAQVDQFATAEDVVQETFVSFLKSLDRVPSGCEIETLLFQILRRRIVDHYRVKGRRKEVNACECMDVSGEFHRPTSLLAKASVDISPAQTWEHHDISESNRRVLSQAIRAVCGRLRSRRKFRDLKIAEGTLYASLPNPKIAEFLDCAPSQVATVKHRLIERLAKSVQQLSPGIADSDPLPESMLLSVWEQERPSCPKRTTLGKYVLGLLPGDWHAYVKFHTAQLGCRFCAANLGELSLLKSNEGDASVSDRLIQSTIGFLK